MDRPLSKVTEVAHRRILALYKLVSVLMFYRRSKSLHVYTVFMEPSQRS